MPGEAERLDAALNGVYGTLLDRQASGECELLVGGRPVGAGLVR